MPKDMSPVLPEKVTVYYPGRRCIGTPSDGVPLWHDVDWKLEDIEFTDPDLEGIVFTGVPTAILIIHDTCQAIYGTASGTGPIDLTNGSALDDLTSQIAQDFYDFRSFNIDFAYVSICAVQPVALYDYIEFIYDADEPDDQDNDRIEAIQQRLRPNISTRIFTEPWNGEVQEMQHMDPDIKDCTDKNNSDQTVDVVPCILYYGADWSCTGGGAKAYANISTEGGVITSVTMVIGGTYTSTPKVVISGDGTGAKMTAVIGGGSTVTSVTVDYGGANYTYAIISFDGGGTKLQLARMKLCLEDGRLVSTFISYDTIG